MKNEGRRKSLEWSNLTGRLHGGNYGVSVFAVRWKVTFCTRWNFGPE